MPETGNPLVVVTGASGFLGKAVLSVLSEARYRIFAVDRNEPKSELSSEILFHRSALDSPADLLPYEPDVVGEFTLVHLAWNMRRGSLFEPQSDQVTLLASLLDYWKNRGLTKVVALGSAEEYGRAEGLIGEETVPDGDLSPYGWAKRASWSMASSWSRRESIPLFWLRPFIIFGPQQSGRMLLPSAIESARKKQPAEFTDGLQERDFVFVRDVANAIQLAVACRASGAHAVNLGSGNSVKVKDVLNYIADKFDAHHCFDIGARKMRAGEPKSQYADISKAKALLGWSPRMSLKGGMHEIFRDLKD